jgi:hypothetical protein
MQAHTGTPPVKDSNATLHLRHRPPLADNAPMTQRDDSQRFGEVVEASVDRLVAQCHRLYEAPPLGSLVRTGDASTDGGTDPVYAVVAGVATASLDPTRRVIARGADADSEAEIQRQHPQLERLLRTDVTLSVVGHAQGSQLHQYLPPSPPRIHTFVYTCGLEDVRRFTQDLDFVTLLAGTRDLTTDDVLAAALRLASVAYDQPRDFLVRAGRAVASLLSADTARVSAVLRRLPL